MVTASTAMSTLSLHDALPISYVLANVYRRAAIGEALALAIVPWLLAAVLSTLRRPSALGTLGVAFATAALLASHLLTAGAAAVLAVGLTAASLWGSEWRAVPGRLAAAGAGALLGMALAAWSWVPALA